MKTSRKRVRRSVQRGRYGGARHFPDPPHSSAGPYFRYHGSGRGQRTILHDWNQAARNSRASGRCSTCGVRGVQAGRAGPARKRMARIPRRGDSLSAVGEAFNNVVIHAYQGRTDGMIDLRILDRAGRIRVDMRDWGRASFPSPFPSPPRYAPRKRPRALHHAVIHGPGVPSRSPQFAHADQAAAPPPPHRRPPGGRTDMKFQIVEEGRRHIPDD